MARIQHRNIADSELHEIKGAASALEGSVPVASGTGTTVFQKVGVSSLAGGLPTTIADQVIATDNAGGFKILSPIYGRFLTTKVDSPLSYSTTALITPQGMNLFGSGIRVNTAGFYWLSSDVPFFIPAEGGNPDRVEGARLFNVTSGAIVAYFQSGIVFLDNSSEYRLDRTSGFSLWRINV